jgi:glucan endo-1,3-alpha-glucosidase
MHRSKQRTRRTLPHLLLLLCFLISASARAQRLVFAHYMLANQDTTADTPTGDSNIAAYQREIQQAQSIGVDGFALNAGGWSKEPRYIRRASEMFEAAYRLHTNFKLMFSADMCCSNDAADVLDMVRRFANNPRYAGIYFQHDGLFVLTTFAGDSRGPEFWQQLRSNLEHGTSPSLQPAPEGLTYVAGVPSSAPLPIFLVTSFFWGGETPTTADIVSGLAPYQHILDGAFYWGIAGSPGLGHSPDQLPSSAAYASTLHTAHKLYMAPICFQFWGANANRYYEYSGYQGMRALWMQAIQTTHPDWVEIITWNDFIEGTYVSPIDDPAKYPGANDLGASIAPIDTQRFFHSHRGATDLLAYFIAWYKTGHPPTLHNDTIYWAYRTVLSPESSPAHEPPIKLYGPVGNTLYVTANLTAPADLSVTLDATTMTLTLPAGSNDLQLPLTPGPAPRFTLTRNHVTLAHSAADDPITATTPYPNLYNSTGSLHD